MIGVVVVSLEQQVGELADRAEITELVYRVYRWLDEGAEEPERVFSRDVRAVSPGGEAVGIDDVVALATRNHAPDKRFHHLMTNVVIDLEGDRAVVLTNGMFSAAPAAAEGQVTPQVVFQLGGRSRWEAVRTTSGWRMSVVDHSSLWAAGTL